MKNFNPNPYNNTENFQCSIIKDELHVDLMYPNINKIKHVVFNQESVRASDGIRISYDYDRDVYVIEQPAYTTKEQESKEWSETGFFQSWALEEEYR